MTGKHALKTPPKAAKSGKAATAGNATATDPPRDARARLTAIVRHPAAAPTAVTLVAVLLVMGVGWLNDSSEPEPSRLATPLAAGGSSSGSSSSSGSNRGAASQEAATEGTVVVIQGRRAIALNTWMDVPLVAPAVAANPTAPYTMIPGAEPTTPPPPGSGSSGGSTGAGGASGSSGGSGSTATTVTTTTGSDPTPTTDPPDTTPTTADTTPPPTETPTTETPTTETPTTETPTTETPTTEPPVTLPPDPVGGLLGAVDDLVGDVTGLLLPPL